MPFSTAFGYGRINIAMTWTSVGIGASILGAILAIVFWLWPRAKAKGALRGATATIGHTSNIGNVIVGSGNVVHA